MSRHNSELLDAICELLRSRAAALALDPASITSPAPGAIIGRRTPDGALVRLDVSTYDAPALSR